jgi:soluble lytic murein transglycosylase-like protein
MRPKKLALCVTIFFALIAGLFIFIDSPAKANNPNRTPRTDGTVPDLWTRMELASLVNRHAREAQLPAEFVRAVVRVESEWDQDLTGLAGEIGLMQILPATARDIGFLDSTEALYDPETNIRWGIRYLSEAYRLANGDLCQTVLKYNAGHGATKMTGAAEKYCTRVRGFMASNN